MDSFIRDYLVSELINRKLDGKNEGGICDKNTLYSMCKRLWLKNFTTTLLTSKRNRGKNGIVLDISIYGTIVEKTNKDYYDQYDQNEYINIIIYFKITVDLKLSLSFLRKVFSIILDCHVFLLIL